MLSEDNLVQAPNPARMAAPDMTSLADALLSRLFPICRSITGDGVRQTLRILKEVVPFDTYEVPTGATCFDWQVPNEWTIRDAFIADLNGVRIVDFKKCNVHVVSYSEPVDAELTFDELKPHLHTHEQDPDAIPYRTTYYKRSWGFCLSRRQFESLDRSARYRVKIDATLAPGSLTYGERVLRGTSDREYLVSTYCCHPSLANDNLSGIVLWTLLLSTLAKRTLQHTYRFVIVPETIGSIVYLSINANAMRSVRGGFVVSTVGGPGGFSYKRTFETDAAIDRVVRQTFLERDIPFKEHPFDLLGSDERSYSGPGFRIPVGTIAKDKYYEYPQYHTSLDNLDFVKASAIIETLDLYLHAIEILEQDRTYVSQLPGGEPQLGKRGLYPQAVGGSITPANRSRRHDAPSATDKVSALLSAAFWADGQTSLLTVAERSGLPVAALFDAAQRLAAAGVLREVTPRA